MSEQARLAVASALAPLAVLAVVVSGVSAAVGGPSDGTATGTDDPATSASSASSEPTEESEAPVPDGYVRVDAEDGRGSYAAPDGDGWDVDTGTSLGFQSEDGSADIVAVGSASIFEDDWCDAEDTSSRAFTGFTRVEGGRRATTQTGAAATVERWAEVITDGRGGPDATTTPLRLDSGAAAWTSVAVIPDADTGPCGAPGLEVRSVVTQDSDGGLVGLVLVRDVRADGDDLPESLDSTTADTIARSVVAS